MSKKRIEDNLPAKIEINDNNSIQMEIGSQNDFVEIEMPPVTLVPH